MQSMEGLGKGGPEAKSTGRTHFSIMAYTVHLRAVTYGSAPKNCDTVLKKPCLPRVSANIVLTGLIIFMC